MPCLTFMSAKKFARIHARAQCLFKRLRSTGHLQHEYTPSGYVTSVVIRNRQVRKCVLKLANLLRNDDTNQLKNNWQIWQPKWASDFFSFSRSFLLFVKKANNSSLSLSSSVIEILVKVSCENSESPSNSSKLPLVTMFPKLVDNKEMFCIVRT